MSKSKKLAKSVLIIIIMTIGSKLLGFFRETLIAAKFGSGMLTDTFFIALTATSLVTTFLSQSISTTFIPILSEIELKEGKSEKLDHVNNMLNILFIFSIILVIVTYIFTPNIIKIIASGFEGEQFDLAVNLTRIGLPVIMFGGILGTFTGYLQYEQRFMATAITGIPFNLIYIIFLLFGTNAFGIKGLMVTAVISVISQLLIQIPELKAIGYKYSFQFNLKDVYINRVLLLCIPVLISVGINDINTIVDRTLASSLAIGSISALNYANKLNTLILGIFISAITTVIFPLLSKESNNEDSTNLKSIMRYGINIILLITIPATVGMIALARPIVEIAFQRGQFDIIATKMTSQALIFYSIGLVAMALRTFLHRVYYSLQDTKTPMINSIVSLILNIILNLILVKPMAHSGLALATSLASIISVIYIYYGLEKKIGTLGTKEYINTFLKVGLASIIMGIVAYFTYYGLYSILGLSKLYNLISLVVAVGLAVIVYGVLCYLFKVEEVRDIINNVKMRLAK